MKKRKTLNAINIRNYRKWYQKCALYDTIFYYKSASLIGESEIWRAPLRPPEDTGRIPFEDGGRVEGVAGGVPNPSSLPAERRQS